MISKKAQLFCSEEAANNIIKLYGKKLKVKEILSDKAATTAGK